MMIDLIQKLEQQRVEEIGGGSYSRFFDTVIYPKLQSPEPTPEHAYLNLSSLVPLGVKT